MNIRLLAYSLLSFSAYCFILSIAAMIALQGVIIDGLAPVVAYEASQMLRKKRPLKHTVSILMLYSTVAAILWWQLRGSAVTASTFWQAALVFLMTWSILNIGAAWYTKDLNLPATSAG